MAENILETNENGKLQTASFGLFHNVGDVHVDAAIMQRPSHNVTLVIDVEIFRAPAIDVIQRARRLYAPVAA